MDNYKTLTDLLQSTVSQPLAAGGSSYAFSDADLKDLREQIKRIIIPKLIRVFELKLAAQQIASPPSRLTAPRQSTTKFAEIRSELVKLSEDLQLLQIWCESCQKQIARASEEVDLLSEKYEQS